MVGGQCLVWREAVRNKIHSKHYKDEAGNPEGGTTYGIGFSIGWQHGPLGRGMDRQEPNGAFVEDIIAAAMDRLEFYQNSRFPYAENDEALAHLIQALRSLEKRTAGRERRGVEGMYKE